MANKELVYFNIVDVNGVHAELLPGDKVTLVKSSTNLYDDETIHVLHNDELIGFVANSVYTAILGTYSAGRLFDKIEDNAEATIIIRHNKAPDIAIGGIYL